MFLKKTLAASAAALGAAVIIPASVLAAPNVVTGDVTINGIVTEGAKVTVTCHNNTTGVDTLRRDTADQTGHYYVQFPKAKCPTGSTVSVQAVKGRRAATKTTTIPASGNATVNVNVQTVAVPEFGPIAGLTAAAAAGGGLLVIRRRQLGQQA